VREKVVTQVYDVSDIIYGMRNYPFSSALVPPALTESNSSSGGGSGGGGGLFGGAAMPEQQDFGAQARREAIDELTKLLTQVVATDSWVENGGTVGTIRVLGGKLIITQTEATHTRVAQLLKEIKGSSKTARTVTVNARWLRLSPEQVAGIVGKDEKGSINSDAIKSLPADATVYRGTIRCLDGQTVHLQSGTGRTTVVDLTAVVSDEVAALEPSVRLLHAGLSLQVTPQIDSEGKTALVDVHSIYSDRHPDGEPISVQNIAAARSSTTKPTAPGEVGRVDTSAKVDRLEVISQQLQTSLRLRLGQPTLIGGMTLEPIEKGDARQLYLVVDLSVEAIAP
jgi:hypothetical protein